MYFYQINVYCLGFRHITWGSYATDWDAIDSVWAKFPQADVVIPRRINTIH